MADKIRITVSESFESQNKDELRENVQRVMDEYASLSEKGFELCEKKPERQ